MSAIGGIFHRDGRPCGAVELESLAALLRHRSPDGIETWMAGPVGLMHGHCVIAPESAAERQPLVGADGRLAMTFDGRIDNRTELLDQLGIDRVDHAAVGDAQLVLRLYRSRGLDCAARLLGDFAFAIWDAALNRLVCCRDHLGIKPLCYRLTADRFVVASETGALARYNGEVPEPDEGMIAEHLAGIVTSTSDTVFRGISRLPAGHLLVVDAGDVRLHRYWAPDLETELHYADPREYAEALHGLVREAVAARMRVNGPVAISLSGGVDSSSVGGVAATLCRERAVPATRVEAFSVLSSGAADESAYWSQVAARWQLPLHTITTPPLPAGQIADEARFYLDVPNSPLAAMTDRMRAAMVAGGARVALTGCGGDEWLGPSPFVYADLVRHGRLIALARRLRGDAADEWFMGWPRACKYAIWPVLPTTMQQIVRRVLRTGRTPAWIDAGFAARVALRDRLARHTIDLPYDTLERYDTWHEGISGSSAFIEETIERSSARQGIEMRHPLMDLRIVTFGLALPSAERWRDGRAKDLLRRAMQPYLPPAIAARTSSPDATALLFESLGREGGRDLFRDMAAAARGWVREDVVLACFNRAEAFHRAGDRRFAPLAMRLWRVAAIELWARAMRGETVVQ